MIVRRSVLLRESVFYDGLTQGDVVVRRIAACAVVANPLAHGRVNLSELVDLGARLGEELARQAASCLTKPAIAYGKAAIVGVAGEIEHGAAILHPRMGKPVRAAIGGGKALIPSNVKIGGPGTVIDVPLGHKDDAWSFDEIDTMSLMLPASPRPDEVVVILVLADGGRPAPRVGPGGVK